MTPLETVAARIEPEPPVVAPAGAVRYATRYFPGETRYLEEIDPASLADIVVDTP